MNLDFKRIVSEMIHIKEQNVSLNLNSDTELLDESYSDILGQGKSSWRFSQ